VFVCVCAYTCILTCVCVCVHFIGFVVDFCWKSILKFLSRPYQLNNIVREHSEIPLMQSLLKIHSSYIHGPVYMISSAQKESLNRENQVVSKIIFTVLFFYVVCQKTAFERLGLVWTRCSPTGHGRSSCIFLLNEEVHLQGSLLPSPARNCHQRPCFKTRPSDPA
jgi:hypothetical protein